MDAKQDDDQFSEEGIKRLKEKYSKEMRESESNPIKICMTLIFSSATEKDPKKRLELALKLSEFLTEPGGIVNLFLALLDFDASSQISTTHSQRFTAVSNIIACLPKLCLPYEQYCDNIFKQLKPMLISDNAKYSSLACTVLKSMIESPHAKTRDIASIFLAPILGALEEPEAKAFMPREAVISIYHMLQNHLSPDLFVKTFPNLFYCLVCLNKTPSRLKSHLKSSLVSILDGLEPGVSCCLLEQTVFYNEKVASLYQVEAEENGEISVKVANSQTDVHDVDIYSDAKKDVVVGTLEDSRNELLVLEFYFHFQSLMWTVEDPKIKKLSASLIEPLLLESIEEKSSKLDLLSIIATNAGRSLELILRTLLNYVSFLRSSYTDLKPDQKLVSHSVSNCLSILEVLCATSCDNQTEILFKTKCLPVLQELHSLLSKHDQQNELCHNIDSLIKRFAAMESSQRELSDTKSAKEYDIILKDFNDKLVPVRVHALVRLKQMVMANEKYVVSKIPELYPLVEILMCDPEPYVYLACVNLMVEMTLRETDFMLPKLIATYSDSGSNGGGTVAGEVLARVIRQLNETTPFYAQQVIDTLLKGCRNSDELKRIASLTIMGEICRRLSYSLGRYMVGVLSLVETVISNDTLDVKCAAIDLLRTSLMGLDRFSAESVQRELKSIYQLLKKLKFRTLDDKLCLQLDLALDEMDRIARELILGDMESGKDLVKEIKVMSILDDH